MGIVSNAVYRKAKEIVNRGDIQVNHAAKTYLVYRQDTGTTGIVTQINTKNGPRFRSTGKHFQSTRRQDTYITAVKIALGLPVTVANN